MKEALEVTLTSDGVTNTVTPSLYRDSTAPRVQALDSKVSRHAADSTSPILIFSQSTNSLPNLSENLRNGAPIARNSVVINVSVRSRARCTDCRAREVRDPCKRLSSRRGVPLFLAMHYLPCIACRRIPPAVCCSLSLSVSSARARSSAWPLRLCRSPPLASTGGISAGSARTRRERRVRG